MYMYTCLVTNHTISGYTYTPVDVPMLGRGTDALLHSVSAPWAKLLVLGRLSSTYQCGGFPKMGVLQNGWFILDNHIKMDDLGGTPPF